MATKVYVKEGEAGIVKASHLSASSLIPLKGFSQLYGVPIYGLS